MQVGDAAAAFNEILGDNPLDDPVPQGSRPINGAAASMVKFQQPEVVIRVPTTRDRLKQALNELPDAVHEARITMQEFRVVLESANKNFRNLEGFTEPLGQRGNQIANSIVEAAEGLDKLVEEFTVLSQALNSREGTLGQLIHNRQLYENLNRLVHNANQVVLQVNDITLGLRPVVNDARIFMDKVAREPGRVVTGGLNPSPIK
jgi:phospholipid/cholesterol/gamma-HCH transport system substrate-binding protein